MRINSVLLGCLAIAGLAGCRSDNKDGAAMKPATKNEQPAAATQVTSKDGARIAFERAGNGPPLILVSGALSHRAMLRGNPLVPMLAEHFTVYAYDRRGRGESTDAQPYAVQREIDDLEALIAHAGQPVYLFGASSGAALSMQAAAALGERKVRKLALYEPPFGQEPAAFAKQKQAVADAIESGKPGDAAELFLTGIGTPRDAMDNMKQSPQWDAIAKMDFTLNYDFAILGDGAIPEDTVRAIAVPTLVMTGGNSLPFMGPTGDRIAALLRDGRRKTFAGQTHQVDARVVVPALREFFDRTSS
jgi:pimeloyl-ACP methyl ester carboxylesterase